MAECSNCHNHVRPEDTYCRHCGNPITSREKKQAIRDRIAYGVGFLVIVSGLSVLPNQLPGISIVIGGVQLLPPTREVLKQILGRRPKQWFMVFLSSIFILIGVIPIYLL